jgi:hypothetical protein
MSSECENKVIQFHQDNYKRTYEQAGDVFFEYFIQRENMLHHTFAYPEIAFNHLAEDDQNYIAAKMIKKAAKRGLTSQDIVKAYRDSLASGELCQALGEKYKRPRRIRAFIFKKLKI